MAASPKPNKAISMAIGELLIKQGGQATADGLALHYTPALNSDADHVLLVCRSDGKEPTRPQEERALASLLLALRNVSRGGGHVVTVYPTRDGYRSTVSGRLCAVYRWQSVSPAHLFASEPLKHHVAHSWLAAVDDLAAHDQAFSDPAEKMRQLGLL